VKWQPVQEQADEVRFQREASIGRLHPIAPGDPANLPGEVCARPRITDMLDHRVGKADIEGAIPKRKSQVRWQGPLGFPRSAKVLSD
jgi:hypothetical protein